MNKKRPLSISPPSELEVKKEGQDDNSVKKNRLEDGKEPDLYTVPYLQLEPRQLEKLIVLHTLKHSNCAASSDGYYGL